VITYFPDLLEDLTLPFDYDEVVRNTLTGSYEFMKEGQMCEND
jgi:hypothetical protein